MVYDMAATKPAYRELPWSLLSSMRRRFHRILQRDVKLSVPGDLVHINLWLFLGPQLATMMVVNPKKEERKKMLGTLPIQTKSLNDLGVGLDKLCWHNFENNG